MATNKILNEDWTDYDNRKIRDKRDGNFFACTESWEVDYLKSKIKKLFPHLKDEQIIAAIMACCVIVGAPHPRKTFVECVVKRLELK